MGALRVKILVFRGEIRRLRDQGSQTNYCSISSDTIAEQEWRPAVSQVHKRRVNSEGWVGLDGRCRSITGSVDGLAHGSLQLQANEIVVWLASAVMAAMALGRRTRTEPC